ncbi:hypothetical protein M758_2G096500 [Ceratodon purpureus]|nr:hypothetical protein M758_2G096500 [Ceratodon purpureus]
MSHSTLRDHDIEASSLSDQLQRLSIGQTEILRKWRSLPAEVQYKILAHLPLNELYKVRLVSKRFRNVVKRRSFHQARALLHLTEFSLSPLVFYAEKDSSRWYLRGFDYKEKTWRKLPPFTEPIPAPDPDLFKDFHVAGDKGLFCVNVGKASESEKLYVCNLLTGATFKLPALEYSRHPVIVCVHVTLAKRKGIVISSFLVIAIGSAAIGTEGLSRKTEVYDSVKGQWEAAEDVPGADFSLNDYQTGVYCERLKLLLCVGFMVNGRKGILAFDVEKRKWREDWICPFHQLDPVTEIALTVYFAIAQLVECSGRIYLFSEQEAGRNVSHCIDRLDLESGSEGFTWTRVVKRERQGNRALLVYPEYTCVPVGENKLCIFNTIERTGVIYDMLKDSSANTDDFESIPLPPSEDGIMFHSLNPVGYAFEPSFGVSVPKNSEDPEEPEDLEEPEESEVVENKVQGNL